MERELGQWKRDVPFRLRRQRDCPVAKFWLTDPKWFWARNKRQYLCLSDLGWLQ